MGAYMSKPIVEKQSEDGSGNGLKYGGSSMQGWRVSQEDAHNCVAELDEKSSFFGVYDGHGGAEVAIYLSRHFPEIFKNTESYKKGAIDEALKELFLSTDQKIKEEEAMEEIKAIVKEVNGEKNAEGEGESSVDYEDENVGELYEEATMPLDKLVEKYQAKANAANENENSDAPGGSGSSSSSDGPCSSRKIAFVSASAGCSSSGGSSSKSSSGSGSGAGTSSSSLNKTTKDEVPEVNVPTTNSTSKPSSDEQIKIEVNGGSSQEVNSDNSKEEVTKPSKSPVPEEKEEDKATKTNGSSIKADSSSSAVNGDSEAIVNSDDHKLSNGDQIDSSSTGKSDPEPSNAKDAVKVESDTSEVAETPPPKVRKGKVHPTPVLVTQTEDSKSKRRSPRKSGLASLAFGTDSDDSDLDSSDSDHPDPGGDSDEDSDDAEEEEEEDTSSGEDDEDSDEEEDDEFLSGIQEPVYDSGTTAVVAVLTKQEEDKLSLWVANAGDSRCVLSRKGEAIEMSHDHKPESEEETLRIVNAGGKITEDGRVNGGLNLSRAIGDHSYKANTDLPPEEQMISPMPTIQHIEIDRSLDDFMILACDGVWNSLSSQEVVDFVAARIATASSLSSICEELFDACLAPNTHGDGTGCDNMTAIIVQLREPSSRTKRSLDSEESTDESAAQANKKCKVAE